MKEKKGGPDFNLQNFHTVPQRCINVRRKSLFSPPATGCGGDGTPGKSAGAQGHASQSAKAASRRFTKSPRPCFIHKTRAAFNCTPVWRIDKVKPDAA